MKKKEFKTIGEYFFWEYANMSMAHVALRNSHLKYEKSDYMIRAKLYKGLVTGTQHISSIYNDEKDKLSSVKCSYCGCGHNLSLDHLIPRYLGGSDSGENLVYACKSCNSSKNKNDLLLWQLKNNCFPPILVLRRYLKLAYTYFLEGNYMNLPYEQLETACDLFRIDLLPYQYPQPQDLIL